ncbi:glycylpeptide N-tetradecanoyltransferase 2-like protein [Leptotrombidium deliense]|uniref:Glycylpeptide N-tetradecanoyltransferase n=1 Tax=Leptotrombidium deliense TaxID=299467 RepID=A0A443SCD9_9ACAR|nr:glycylpeptide N-tetradecanoyltransferase 2-like protein [Leptotrombidium deliense]
MEESNGSDTEKKSVNNTAKFAGPLPATEGSDDAMAASAASQCALNNLQEIKKAVKMMSLVSGVAPKSPQEALKKKYHFWETQPVPKLDENVNDEGPIEGTKKVEEVRKEPYTLPEGFEWNTLDIDDPVVLKELYQLLNENYVEDDDNMFRFDYSPEFLQWALKPPHWKQEWHCGVRVSKSNKLVGFISAVPATIRIKESGVFQAVYTAGVILPKPIGTCRYWHRSLNPKKLIDVKFSHLSRNMNIQRTIKLYKLPENPKMVGFRKFERKDVKKVHKKLNDYLSKFDLTPVYSHEEVLHWFLPRPDVVDSYVVEQNHEIIGFTSFYTLPSTVMHHPTYKSIKAAYSFYNVPGTKISLQDLMNDALIIAKSSGYDVFNALDLMENKTVLENLKFGVGDGNLQYYLFNYKCPSLPPEKGFGLSKDVLFNYHPFFMIFGMLFLYGNSVIIYRVLPFKKFTVKLCHGGLNLVSFIFALFALFAVFKSHFDAVSFFLLNYLFGFTAFLYPGYPLIVRAIVLPYHQIAGKLLFFFVTISCLTGLMEKSGWITDYSSKTAETYLANFLALSIGVFASLIVVISLVDTFKRKEVIDSDSEENTLVVESS